VPLLPCVIWGSQRVFTKGRPKDLTRGTPIRIVVGEPFLPDPEQDPVVVTAELKRRMQLLLDEAQATYAGGPRASDDTWWIPAGWGHRPTVEQARCSSRRRTPSAGPARRRGALTAPTTGRATYPRRMALFNRSSKPAPARGPRASRPRRPPRSSALAVRA
jgi:hypothetical protein